jgi:hypothetical protein
MKNIAQPEPPPEPAPDLVESAIVKILEIAHRQGITVADFIQMLNFGMPISAFLGAIDAGTVDGHAIDYDIVN